MIAIKEAKWKVRIRNCDGKYWWVMITDADIGVSKLFGIYTHGRNFKSEKTARNNFERWAALNQITKIKWED